jgi:hypothetical protein
MKDHSRLDKLKLTQKILNARIKVLESRAKKKEKKQELKRQRLVGAYYLKKARENDSMGALIQALEPLLKRKSDRALFGLSTKIDKIFDRKGKTD